MQTPDRQPISADQCVMLSQQHFDGSAIDKPEIIVHFLKV